MKKIAEIATDLLEKKLEKEKQDVIRLKWKKEQIKKELEKAKTSKNQ